MSDDDYCGTCGNHQAECECGPGDDDPEDGPDDEDLTTEDHAKFWQGGKLVLTVREGRDWKAEVKAYMNRDQFWPNVWFVSDHGNPHLLDLRDES